MIGFHLTFDAMHIPGLLGLPRRIYTYEPGRGWEPWNVMVTVGVPFQALAIVVFVANLVWSYFRGPHAGNDPWDAWTLESSTSSPPPVYNFASVPVRQRRRQPHWRVGRAVRDSPHRRAHSVLEAVCRSQQHRHILHR